MTLSENIAAREALIPQIKKFDKQITDLTAKESQLTHVMCTTKDFNLLKELDSISKELKSLRRQADILDKQHWNLIQESVRLCRNK